MRTWIAEVYGYAPVLVRAATRGRARAIVARSLGEAFGVRFGDAVQRVRVWRRPEADTLPLLSCQHEQREGEGYVDGGAR